MSNEENKTKENSNEVKTNIGDFKLKAPDAGDRNDALIKAESDNGKIRQFVFLTTLLPTCIIKHPFTLNDMDKRPRAEKVAEKLKRMKIKDYDLLTKALGNILNIENKETKDLEKK